MRHWRITKANGRFYPEWSESASTTWVRPGKVVTADGFATEEQAERFISTAMWTKDAQETQPFTKEQLARLDFYRWCVEEGIITHGEERTPLWRALDDEDKEKAS